MPSIFSGTKGMLRNVIWSSMMQNCVKNEKCVTSKSPKRSKKYDYQKFPWFGINSKHFIRIGLVLWGLMYIPRFFIRLDGKLHAHPELNLSGPWKVAQKGICSNILRLAKGCLFVMTNITKWDSYVHYVHG